MPRPNPNEVLPNDLTRQQMADIGAVIAVGLHVMRNPEQLVPSQKGSSILLCSCANLARLQSMEGMTKADSDRVLDQLDEIAVLCQRFANQSFLLHAPEESLGELLFEQKLDG